MQRNKSNKKFMVLSAIGIFMVVDQHTFTAFNLFGSYMPYNSFFMPMFVFISGYFNKVDGDTKLLPYLGKKAKTLLLPYAGIAFFVFLMQQLINAIKLGEFEPLPAGYLQYVLENVITTGAAYALVIPMWFVISLFSTLIVYAVLKKIMVRIWNSYLMLVIFLCFHLLTVSLGQSMDAEAIRWLLLPLKVMFFLPFLELGMIYCDHLEEKHTKLSGGYKIGLLFLLIFINTIRTLYLPIPYDLAFDSIDDLTGFTSPYIVTPFVSSVIGILFWLTMVDLVGRPVYESRFVNFLSCNTFWVMGMHIMFFNILNCVLMAVSEHIAELPYFDTEYFRGSEWYYWELSPNFKAVYVIVGILGPLGLKWCFDNIFKSFLKICRKSA